MPESRWSRAVAYLIVGGALAIAAAATLVGSTPDEEEFRFAVLSAWLHVHAIARGDFGYWTPLLGFGLPQPFSPNFWWHPLTPLLAVMSPVSWVRLLLFTHAVVGIAGMWRLTRAVGLSPLVRAVCVSTFLLATPAQNYILTDFWPSHWIVWTSMPWLLLLAWHLLEAQGRTLWWWSIALGLCGGLVVANTNLGHLLVYGSMAAAVLGVRWRAASARWGAVALAALVAAAVAMPNLLQLAHERSFFEERGLANLPDPLPWPVAWHILFTPLRRPEWWPRLEGVRFERSLFFGGPFALLALWGALRCGWRHLDLAMTVAFAAALLFTPLLPLGMLSARYHFRDPLILASIPLAGVELDRLLRGRRSRWIAYAVMVVQIVVVTTAAWPSLAATWSADGRNATIAIGATARSRPVSMFLAIAHEPGRLLYSPRVERDVYDRRLVRDGFGVNALAFRGFPVVNGTFKGVSAGTIWPDDHLFYARVMTPPQLVESPSALNVLAVRYVLARQGEPVASGLVPAALIPSFDGTMLHLYENRAAWPEAFLLSGSFDASNVAVRGECGNSGLLCRDFDGVASQGNVTGVRVDLHDAQIDVTVPVAAESRLLVVSQMFRDEWIGRSASGPLTVEPVLGGLVGIRLPAGVDHVSLRYRPSALIRAATWLAACALTVGLLALAVFGRTRPTCQDFASPPATAQPA